jgi:hypothetical protein
MSPRLGMQIPTLDTTWPRSEVAVLWIVEPVFKLLLVYNGKPSEDALLVQVLYNGQRNRANL